MRFADVAGALLCFEAGARLEEFRGRIDAARALFRAGKARVEAASGSGSGGGGGGSGAAASRFLREWAAFEKRAGDLQARARA